MASAPHDRAAEDHLMRRIRERSDLPPVVYHYTTAEGLLGIVGKKQIWATDIRFLNDAKEFAYTLELASEHLNEEKKRVRNEREEQVLAGWIRLTTRALKVRLYVASFSKNGDQLSQWRAYGQGAGYSIGFDPLFLMQRTFEYSHIGAFLPCVYSRDVQISDLQYLSDHHLHRFRAWLAATPAPENPFVDQLGFHVDFFMDLLTLAGCFKHHTFEEEQEWRLIFHQDETEKWVRDREFRDGGRTIVPYLAVPLAAEKQVVNVKRIYVGPTPHMPLAMEAAKLLMQQEEVADVEIKPSETPYRDW